MNNGKTRIGINGFGRIGRLVLRAANEEKYPNLEIVAINSFADAENNAHMFKYDSTYGVYKGDVSSSGNSMYIDGNPIVCLSSQEPRNIPWDEHKVDIVLECTGKFTNVKKASEHLSSGASKVIISAPAKGEDVTVVMGVNEDEYNHKKDKIVSNASCTTNCVAPLVKVLHDSFGIEHAMMTTIHAYTNDQQILDKRHKDMRRARAAATNIIPTTTGAAKAVGTVIPELKGKVHGMAFRVPTSTVSVTDVVANLKRKATTTEINEAYLEASNSHLRGILDFSMEPLVSSDYKQNPYSCIIDGLSTITLDGNMVKVVGWYDNEWAYSLRTLDLANHISNKAT